MVKKILLLIVFVFAFTRIGFAENLPEIPDLDRAFSVEEEDGDPSIFDCRRLKVANDTLTDNFDGTASFAPSSSGDITSVGDVASGAAFDGTQGTILTFNNAGGDGILGYDANNAEFYFDQNLGIGTTNPTAKLDVVGLATGAFGAYDAAFGDTLTPDYGAIRIGRTGIYCSSFSNSNTKLGGALVLRQEANIDAANDPGIEFAFIEQGNTIRLAIPESGAGNATAMLRSVTIAGPYSAAVGNAIVTGDQWTSYDSNLDFDTSGTGADLFVQDDFEVEGTIYAHETINLEGATADGNQVILQVGADPGADVTLTLPITTGTIYSSAEVATYTDLIVSDGGNIGSASDTDAITILSSGNVGIGTTNPTQALDVVGTVNATALTQGGQTMYDANDVPGGELGGTFASFTIDDGVAVSNWNLTTPTITTSLTTSTPTTISVAELDRLDGLAGIIVTDVTACTDIEGRSLTISGGVLVADAETYAYRGAYGSIDPVATDDYTQVDYFPLPVTITEFRCYSDQTVVVQLMRDDGTAADMFTADVTCDSAGGSACASGCDTTLVAAEDSCAADERINLKTVSVSGTPTYFTCHWFGDYDD